MTPYRIAVVCLGNICRSPIAEVVLTAAVSDAGLGDAVSVESAGTAGYHVGKDMDARAAAALERAGYHPVGHRARRFSADWFERVDLVLAMDSTNLADLESLARAAGSTTPVRLFGSLDAEATGDLDVADPYYGSDEDFDRTVATARRTSAHIATFLRKSVSL